MECAPVLAHHRVEGLLLQRSVDWLEYGWRFVVERVVGCPIQAASSACRAAVACHVCDLLHRAIGGLTAEAAVDHERIVLWVRSAAMSSANDGTLSAYRLNAMPVIESPEKKNV